MQGEGESLTQLHHRVETTLEELARRHPGGNVAIVTHGGPLHAAFLKTVGRNHTGPIPNCSVSVLRIDATQKPCAWALVEWAEVSHMEEVDQADG
jgi:2,3-bisphosphoglycerate-dependent phosphoglycerate mutase